MNELALFAGGGGGILGGTLLGWRTVCAVEINSYCQKRLIDRQRDGQLAGFPIWDDVCTFDGLPWRDSVDVVSGGFPCTDISAAGRGAGIDGKESGLWVEMARIIGEVRPRYAFVENSPMLTSRGLGRVLGDLAAMGFDAGWGVLGAADVGAPHQRYRIWIVADSGRERVRKQPGRRRGTRGTSAALIAGDGQQEYVADNQGDRRRPGRTRRFDSSVAREPQQPFQAVADADDARCGEQRWPVAGTAQYPAVECSGWWATEPDVGRMAHGVASRVDRLRALGNGQVPAVAAAAWRLLVTARAARTEAA